MPRGPANPKTPLPGRPVRGSKTGVAIMAALDLLGRRWSLQIVWELARQPVGFRELQRRCTGISPTVLNQRLTELREAQIIHTDGNGQNELGPLGTDLFQALKPLKSWARFWSQALEAPTREPSEAPPP